MPKMKLTARAIERLSAPHPSGKQVLVWDAELRGFGVLLSGTTNSKAFICQRRLGEAGRKRRITIGAVNQLTLDQARDDAAAQLLGLRRGLDPKAQRRKAVAMTLRAALDDYLNARHDLSECSTYQYRYAIERHLADWLDSPLRAITAEMVQARHRAIASGVAQRRLNRPAHWHSTPGGSTANMAMRFLCIVWNHASESDPDLPPNPLRRLRRQWYSEPRRERLLRSDEMAAFYGAVLGLESDVQRDLVRLMLFSGLRKQEATALRWDELDLTARLIRLPARRMKGGRRLDLPMSDIIFDLLVARRNIAPGPFVFPGSGKTGHVSSAKFGFDEITKATGIKVSAHDLRRTYLTVAEGCDISPLALKALVAHSLGSDVTAGYIISTTERLREPAQRVANKIKEFCGIEAPTGDGIARIA